MIHHLMEWFDASVDDIWFLVVLGLITAALIAQSRGAADPSGVSRKEQLRIYDILIKVERGIRELAKIEHQADESGAGVCT